MPAVRKASNQRFGMIRDKSEGAGDESPSNVGQVLRNYALKKKSSNMVMQELDGSHMIEESKKEDE